MLEATRGEGVHKPLIGTLSAEFAGCESGATARTAPTSGGFSAGNRALAFPFQVWQPITVVKLWIHVGNNDQTNTVDIGIYTSEATPRRLVSIGSTAMAADNTVQEFNITDTTLAPGRYYLAMSCSASSATLAGVFQTTLSNVLGKSLGPFQMASAHPLPSTLTPAAWSSGFSMPFMGMSLRTLVT